MNTCIHCGAEIPEGAVYCPECGQPVQKPETKEEENAQTVSEESQISTQPERAQEEPAMHSPYKGLAIVCYLLGFLGVTLAMAAVPYEKRDGFLRFHANQALVLGLFAIPAGIPIIGWIWGIIVLVLWLIGFINCCENNMKPVPILGGIHILP